MRTPQKAQRALYWRLDPEHEAFRGLGARSAVRLGAVLATIVLLVALIAISLPSSVASRHPLQGILGHILIPEGSHAPG
jgi:hypothetical protein